MTSSTFALRLSFVSLFWLPCAVSHSPVVRADESVLVEIQQGELPIILSAPHGGTREIPDVSPRKGEGIPTGPSGFFTGRDTGTDALCLEVAEAIAARWKQEKKPYCVVARFHRKYLDVNRPSKIGYEDPDAQSVYKKYHESLEQFCREVRTKFHRGLLLDIHGQGSSRTTVFRGTQNGKSVTLLRERFGDAAHNGPDSLFGTLKTLGWTVHPLDGGREQTGFTGGYIVQTYGSHQGSGIDAVQLEFGADYRSAKARKQTAATLAEAVESYLKLYLVTDP
jgi:N-formylglutamate amidohydrolase